MKKLLTFLLIITLVLSLVACSNSDNKSEDQKDSDNKTATEESTNNFDNTDNDDIDNDTDYESDSISDSTSLLDLNVIDENVNYYDKEITDAYGNSYPGPYYDFFAYGKSNKPNQYITQHYVVLNTNGEYKYLTGRFFAKEDQNEESTVELLVYADNELIYCSEPIDRKTRIVDLAVDIKNCNELKITARSYDKSSAGYSNPGIILIDAQVCNGYISNLSEGIYIDPNEVLLTDMHVYGDHSSVLDNIHAGVVEDSYGDIHKGMYLELCSYGQTGGQDYDTQAYTEFVTNGEYQTLSGTFFTRSKQSENYTIELLIYADDELVYSSDMISRSDGVMSFEVDINGCNIVKVMSRSLDHTSTGTNPGIIVMNPILNTY